jgi:hypothetical protein
MPDSPPAAPAARGGAFTMPPPVDRDVFIRTIAERTGAALGVVRVAFCQLMAGGDIWVVEDPAMPSGFAVTPNPAMARYLADDDQPRAGEAPRCR